ncbi:MAG: radical SAM protein [Solirubrobacterales bacterium]
MALVFPPLMNAGFGTYYPSIAVLAGHLLSRGIGCVQDDLNEEVAVDLLNPRRLAELAAGRFVAGAKLDRAAPPVVAAQVLARRRAELFDEEGRHRFDGQGPGLGYLLKALAEPFLIDETIESLCARDLERWQPARWYDRLYNRLGYATRLATAVRLVGISVPMGPQLAPALLLARHVARARPDARIVLGGPTFSLMADRDLSLLLERFPEIAAVVRYDGELPLTALARQCMVGAWGPEKVPGVAVRRNGRLRQRPPVPGPTLKQTPFAHYSRRLVRRLVDPEIGIVQTRGCYWARCAYCDFVELYEGSPRFRNRPAEDFVAELESQVEVHGARRFSLITEAIPPAFSRRFSELVLERGIRVRWSSFAMVDRRFTPGVLRLMARAGCESLVVGVESATDRVLALVDKQSTGAESVRFIRAAAHAGIGVYINLIPDLPTTTYEEALDSLALFRGLRQYLAGVAIFPFEATRSSRIGANPGAYGLEPREGHGGSGQAEYASNHQVVIDTGMSNDERGEVHAAFRAFAEEVVDRRHASDRELGSASSAPAFAVPLEDLDIADGRSVAQIFNARTRETWHAHPGWAALLRSFGERSFGREELERRSGSPAVADHLLRQGLAHGVFVPVVGDAAG